MDNGHGGMHPITVNHQREIRTVFHMISLLYLLKVQTIVVVDNIFDMLMSVFLLLCCPLVSSSSMSILCVPFLFVKRTQNGKSPKHINILTLCPDALEMPLPPTTPI